MEKSAETIAAAATGLPGAIGILRLSGPAAVRAAGAVFRCADGRALGDHPPRTMIYGALTDAEGAVIDRALCTYSPGPASYTGEDTAELHCHGSPLVVHLGLEALFAAGARQAGPGEFTRRAFLNGKLDLAQAEAVVDLIDAQTREGVLQSAGQLGGALSRRAMEIYDGLTDLLAHFHAVLDWPDEDIDPFRREELETGLDGARDALAALLATYRRGRAMTEGIPCAIVGRPNAGKSSLLNAILGYERAIVTAAPGTTRDTVEERARLGGVLLRLIDTAGLRDGTDEAERLGVERARQAMERAGLILLLVDRSAPAGEEDAQLLARAQALAPTILIHTKCDLPPASGERPRDPGEVCVSAVTGQGLDELERAVAALLPAPDGALCGQMLTNARQAEAVGRALAAAERARQGLAAGVTPDALMLDVEEAQAALGELTGRSVRADVTERIFERFCVGK